MPWGIWHGRAAARGATVASSSLAVLWHPPMLLIHWWNRDLELPCAWSSVPHTFSKRLGLGDMGTTAGLRLESTPAESLAVAAGSPQVCMAQPSWCARGFHGAGDEMARFLGLCAINVAVQ